MQWRNRHERFRACHRSALFVYALAIAHLLLTVAGIVRGWNRVRFSWLHAYWMLNALIVLVVDWISFYDLRQIKGWSMPVIFMTIVIALIDYLHAALVCPEIPAEGPIDLVAFHNSQSRRYIAAFGLSAADALPCSAAHSASRHG